MKKHLLTVAAVFALAFASAQAGQILRLADNQTENNPVVKANLYFADLVKEASKGELLVEVYPGAILGEEVETTQQVRAGVIEMVRVNTVPLAEFVKEIGVLTLPYVFVSPEHQKKVVTGDIGKELAAHFDKVGLKLICWYHAGFRNFYTTRKPIEGVESVKGMKLRVQPSQISLKMVELMGGSPTAMSYAEVYSALQTGVIDGAENDYVSYYTSSHYEVARYFSEDGHLAPPAVVVMNLDKFNSLTPDQQRILFEAGEKATEFEFEAMVAFEDEAKEEVIKAGSQIFTVNVEEFQKAVEPIYDAYPEHKAILERIRALQ